MSRRLTAVIASVALMAVCATAQAQYRRAELPLERLPEEHGYQKAIRAYMATLKESDFVVGHKEIAVAQNQDPEALYRMWLLSIHVPEVSAAMLPASAFTLLAIEAQKGLVLPTDVNVCQMLAWLAKWDSPGNPYHGSRALKLRAFVLAAVDVVMLDYPYEHNLLEAGDVRGRGQWCVVRRSRQTGEVPAWELGHGTSLSLDGKALPGQPGRAQGKPTKD